MHTEIKNLSDTQVQITITSVEEDLLPYKNQVLQKLAKQVNIQGFRKGTAPISLVEKNIDQSMLQSEFLDEAMSGLYSTATQSKNIRPVTQPEVTVKKFVPFTALDFEVITEVISKIKLPDYKLIKLAKDKPTVTAKDVDGVIDSLKLRVAEKVDVDRAAKTKDEVWLDFKGVDEKDEPINGADGKDYPLVIGSNTFIPGFEDNVIGLKAGDEKSFTLTFPKDYGVKALANKKVKFTVNINKVQEVKDPELNDEFASKIGPFESMKDLKADIKKQLAIEKQNEIDRSYHNDLVAKIVEKTTVKIPEALIDQQASYIVDDLKRNLTYRGQTYKEFLEQEGLSEENYLKTVANPQAEKQVKTSLVLAEIAELEKLHITPEELEIRLQLLKGQYNDQSMQENLDKPESRNEIASKMLTEKVLEKLEKYSS